MNSTMLSRPGYSSPLGKLDEVIKTHVDEATACKFRRAADTMEQTTSELLRDLVYLYCHGETLLELVAKHRRGLIDLQGPQKGQIRDAVRTAVGC